MEFKEILFEKFFYVLYSMIQKINSKLIFVFFPDKFTSLDEMSDDPYSSWFQYPIDFAKKKIYIFDMLKHKKTSCQIKWFILKGKLIFQITDNFFNILTGLPRTKLRGMLTQ